MLLCCITGSRCATGPVSPPFTLWNKRPYMTLAGATELCGISSARPLVLFRLRQRSSSGREEDSRLQTTRNYWRLQGGLVENRHRINHLADMQLLTFL